MGGDPKGVDRRTFLRRAAVTTATAAWATPVIQSVVARPAYAGTPVECDHSGCIGACAGSGDANTCGGPPGQVCAAACTGFGCGGGGQICSDPAACDPAGWAACVFVGVGADPGGSDDARDTPRGTGGTGPTGATGDTGAIGATGDIGEPRDTPGS